MSRCTPKSNKFISDIYMAINHGYMIRDIKVYYDASKWNRRHYVAEITVYDWNSSATELLKKRMREAGATNIIGGIKHAIARDYLDLAFDIKKSKMKELGIDILKTV